MVVVTAPGKLILFGEHAVVYGEPAIAVAIDRRIRVGLAANEGAQQRGFTVNGFELSPRYHSFIHRAIQQYYDDDGPPLTITTDSELPSASGMGSSAAITVATVGALFARMKKFDPASIAKVGFDVEYTVQGRASPIDTSTSTHGAAILLDDTARDALLWHLSRDDQHWYIHHQELPRLTLVAGNTGVHAKTGPLVAKVRRFVERSGFARDIVREIGELTLDAADALAEADHERIGALMDRNHELLAILGVNHPALERLVKAARKSAYGAKLTGAGGGGSMIALTDDPERTAAAIEKAGGEPIIVEVTTRGVTIEQSTEPDE